MKYEIRFMGKKINMKELKELYGEKHADELIAEIKDCEVTCTIESEDRALEILVY